MERQHALQTLRSMKFMQRKEEEQRCQRFKNTEKRNILSKIKNTDTSKPFEVVGNDIHNNRMFDGGLGKITKGFPTILFDDREVNLICNLGRRRFTGFPSSTLDGEETVAQGSSSSVVNHISDDSTEYPTSNPIITAELGDQYLSSIPFSESASKSKPKKYFVVPESVRAPPMPHSKRKTCDSSDSSRSERTSKYRKTSEVDYI